MGQHLGMINATASLLHEKRDVWDGPRGTVLRIEALVVVTAVIILFDAVIGSCRRWSNAWIVQKGFLATHALSLSLGPYIIGLMQSSSVRSEMYPIWAASLYTLFGCVDPVTTYNAFDYKGLLSKLVYQILVHGGYVLLIGISTMSSGVGKAAIGVLSAITLIKGFHTSLALVQQKRIRDMIERIHDGDGWNILTKCPPPETPPPTPVERRRVMKYGPLPPYYKWKDRGVHLPLGTSKHTLTEDSEGASEAVDMDQIYKVCIQEHKAPPSCYNACAAFCLSHKLHRRFVGINIPTDRCWRGDRGIDFGWAWKLIEVEIGFLYDVFFTGNSYLHYYQAGTASFWVLASFTGICFVGVVATGIHGTRRSSTTTAASSTVVETTAVDLAITLAVLVSAALLQFLQLIRCWTSNWARVAFACKVERYRREHKLPKGWQEDLPWRMRLMRKFFLFIDGDNNGWEELEASSSSPPAAADPSLPGDQSNKLSISLTTTNSWWFDNKYLWQNKLGQHSLVAEEAAIRKKGNQRRNDGDVACLDRGYARMLGLDYIWEVLWDLLGANKAGAVAAVRLDEDVKTAIAGFIDQIHGQHPYNQNNQQQRNHWRCFLTKTDGLQSLCLDKGLGGSDGTVYTSWVMTWHIVTCCCQLAEQEQEKEKQNLDRHVAITLSQYCVHLAASAPGLLPGLATDTRNIYKWFASVMRRDESCNSSSPLSHRDLERAEVLSVEKGKYLVQGMDLVKRLLCDKSPYRSNIPWKVLADGWIRLLVCAASAPASGNADVHMRYLSQGGEFITHLWALLHHLDVRLTQIHGDPREDWEGPCPCLAGVQQLDLLPEHCW